MDPRRSPSVNTQPDRGARRIRGKPRIDAAEIRRRSLERWENEGGRCNEDDLTNRPAGILIDRGVRASVTLDHKDPNPSEVGVRSRA